LLNAPTELDARSLFAIDQFLMRGGTVIASTSPFSASLSRERLSLQHHPSGLEKWLQHNGLKIEEQLVLDPQNSAFPIPVTRQVGALRFQEMRMIDYPYFADLRAAGLNQDNPITSGLNQLNMAWASPITVDVDKNAGRDVTPLLRSSNQSWLSNSVEIMPRIDIAGKGSYSPEGEQGSHLLGVVSQGRFDSYFSGKESPLLAADEAQGKTEEKQGNDVVTSVIEHSPESARIILFASNDFLNDQVIQLAGASGGSDYRSGLQLMLNTVDWSVEDQNLLAIRARGHFNRTLPPMARERQLFWESGNYVIAAALLLALAALQHFLRRRKAKRYFDDLFD
jgi:ABC-2 type transport system permease protein